MNKAFMVGNFTKDPELTQTQSGIKKLNFTLAVNRSYTDGDGNRKTDFFDCVAWRGVAETLAKYCKKGRKLAVVGELETRTYEDRDGVKRKVTEFIVKDFDFCGGSQSERSDAQRGGGQAPEEYDDYPDDGDIPF